MLKSGMPKYSKRQSYKRQYAAKGKFTRKNQTAAPKAAKAGNKWYSINDEKVFAPRKNGANKVALRDSIKKGQVLIILAGRFAGKRCVFLKQLDSGLLLVTGPFKINGVPLRRISQAYVIATSTKVDIKGLVVPEEVNDAYFKKDTSKSHLGRKKATAFFVRRAGSKKGVVPENKIQNQKQVDSTILAAVKAVPYLSSYLSSRFSLTSGDHPHLMKF